MPDEKRPTSLSGIKQEDRGDLIEAGCNTHSTHAPRLEPLAQTRLVGWGSRAAVPKIPCQGPCNPHTATPTTTPCPHPALHLTYTTISPTNILTTSVHKTSYHHQKPNLPRILISPLLSQGQVKRRNTTNNSCRAVAARSQHQKLPPELQPIGSTAVPWLAKPRVSLQDCASASEGQGGCRSAMWVEGSLSAQWIPCPCLNDAEPHHDVLLQTSHSQFLRIAEAWPQR